MIELYFTDYPPSANALWGYGRGRVFKSKAYTAWLEHAGYQLNRQYPGTVVGPYKLTMQVRRGGSGADLDNLIKPLNDLLQAHGVVVNDKHCELVTARRVSAGYDGLYVKIEKAGVE